MFDPKTQTEVGKTWQDEATGKWYKTVRVDDQTVQSVPVDEPEPEGKGKKSAKADL